MGLTQCILISAELSLTFTQTTKTYRVLAVRKHLIHCSKFPELPMFASFFSRGSTLIHPAKNLAEIKVDNISIRVLSQSSQNVIKIMQGLRQAVPSFTEPMLAKVQQFVVFEKICYPWLYQPLKYLDDMKSELDRKVDHCRGLLCLFENWDNRLGWKVFRNITSIQWITP